MMKTLGYSLIAIVLFSGCSKSYEHYATAPVLTMKCDTGCDAVFYGRKERPKSIGEQVTQVITSLTPLGLGYMGFKAIKDVANNTPSVVESNNVKETTSITDKATLTDKATITDTTLTDKATITDTTLTDKATSVIDNDFEIITPPSPIIVKQNDR